VSDRWEVNWVRKDGYIPRPVSNVDRQLYLMATTETGREVLDFIVELVHEIERLQGRVIELDTENDELQEEVDSLNHELDLEWGTA
jgi:hypothetical protein